MSRTRAALDAMNDASADGTVVQSKVLPALAAIGFAAMAYEVIAYGSR
ncbi:MAG: hypothetical protein H6983_26295 [Ectothiorhodospiraceae bacterium]|nr:hypothetical protein [Ectothiorhodospiraceae bacterium]